MITKAQALAFRQAFIATFPSRLDTAIKNAALAGQTSVTVSYAPDTNANATNFLNNVVIPAGWSSSTIDTTAQTITVAP